ncbi:MAG: DinB family protein [Chloroflexota bacterium]|nr:DinB family protein [Chloroflexota bacterium]
MLTPERRQTYISTIADFPATLDTLIAGLTPEQLNTAYLPNEWTVAQNIHHLADSHLNSFIRFKLILLENHPPVKGYNQDDWARSADYGVPIAASLDILRGLHARWAALLRSLSDGDWGRTGTHSENGEISLDDLLLTYHNHCHAHIDQITRTLAAGK